MGFVGGVSGGDGWRVGVMGGVSGSGGWSEWE